MGSRRKIQHGQKIHSSLLLARGGMADDYNPIARPPDDDILFWETLRSETAINRNDRARQWLELDLYEYTKTVLANAIKPDDNFATSQQLRQIASTSAYYTLSCVCFPV